MKTFEKLLSFELRPRWKRTGSQPRGCVQGELRVMGSNMEKWSSYVRLENHMLPVQIVTFNDVMPGAMEPAVKIDISSFKEQSRYNS